MSCGWRHDVLMPTAIIGRIITTNNMFIIHTSPAASSSARDSKKVKKNVISHMYKSVIFLGSDLALVNVANCSRVHDLFVFSCARARCASFLQYGNQSCHLSEQGVRNETIIKRRPSIWARRTRLRWEAALWHLKHRLRRRELEQAFPVFVQRHRCNNFQPICWFLLFNYSRQDMNQECQISAS